VFADWIEARKFTPLSIVRVVTENSNWLLTGDRYQRLPRAEQPRPAVESIDGRLDDAHWHEMQRCWWVVFADGAAAVRILPMAGPPDGVGIVTGASNGSRVSGSTMTRLPTPEQDKVRGPGLSGGQPSGGTDHRPL
jgi:hypothetical protein